MLLLDASEHFEGDLAFSTTETKRPTVAAIG